MIKRVKGIIRGKHLELEGETGIEDGRTVEVTLAVKDLPEIPAGVFPELAGSASGIMGPYWTEEDDRILDEIRRDRKRESGRNPPQ